MLGMVYQHKPTLIRAFFVDHEEAKQNTDKVASLIQEFIGPNWHVGTEITSSGRKWHIWLNPGEFPGSTNYYVNFYESFLIVRDYDNEENAKELVFTNYVSLHKFYDNVPDSDFIDLDLDGESKKDTVGW